MHDGGVRYMENKTIDELIEILQWAVDRKRYCIMCGIRASTAAEAEAIAELEMRGYYE